MLPLRAAESVEQGLGGEGSPVLTSSGQTQLNAQTASEAASTLPHLKSAVAFSHSLDWQLDFTQT